MYITPLHPETQGPLQKSQRGWVTIRDSVFCTAGQLHTWSCDSMRKTSTCPSKTKSQHEEGHWTDISTSSRGTTGDWQLLIRCEGRWRRVDLDELGEGGLMWSKHSVLNSQKASKNIENKTFSMRLSLELVICLSHRWHHDDVKLFGFRHSGFKSSFSLGNIHFFQGLFLWHLPSPTENYSQEVKQLY